MRLIEQIRALFTQFTPFGGTIMLPTGKEEYPVALQNEINGGHHGFNSLEDLAQVPVGFLSVPMLATVKQHTRPDGSVLKATTYHLEAMPPQRISDIAGYDISKYWKVYIEESNNAGALEIRYAPNYNNKRPFFREPDISRANYNAGFASNADQTVIWTTVYDATIPHVWVSQRYGSTSDWGIPIQILSESYEAGDYMDVIFKWVPKDSTPPEKPALSINGQPNNHPVGWSNVPEVPAGDTFENYSLTNDLYRSSSLKDVYQDIKGTGWSIPLKVSSNPNLVRYGNEPASKDFLNADGTNTWKPYFTPGTDTHMASRKDVNSPWVLTQIDNESGEFTDFVYKAFPASYTVTDADTPTAPTPIGGESPNDCRDAPYTPAEDEVLYMSSCKKLSSGAFKTTWSTFFRFDGLDRIQSVIEPQGNYVFKKSKDASGNDIVTPATIVLKPVLYKGSTDISEKASGIRWYRGGFQIVSTTPDHSIDAATNFLTINPAAVTNIQEYRVEVTHAGKVYLDTISVLDMTDGEPYGVSIKAPTGFTFKTETDKTFNSQFYKNGAESNVNVVFEWTLTDTDAGVSRIVAGETITVLASEVKDYSVLKLKATFGSIIREHIETLTDVKDGEKQWVLYAGYKTKRETEGDVYTIPKPLGETTNYRIDYSTKVSGGFYRLYRKSDNALITNHAVALWIGSTGDEYFSYGIGTHHNLTTNTHYAGGFWIVRDIAALENAGWANYTYWANYGKEVNKSTVEWGPWNRVKGEKGNPAGGFSRNVFKISVTQPSFTSTEQYAFKNGLLPTASGWTDSPGTPDTSIGERVWMSHAQFTLKLSAVSPEALNAADWNIIGSGWGLPIQVSGIDGASSSSPGPKGDTGEKGWSPVLAVVSDGERRVHQLKDWVGGAGAKPAGAGQYIGASGLTPYASSAVDIRGAKGDKGADATTAKYETGIQSLTSRTAVSFSSRKDVASLKVYGGGVFLIKAKVYIKSDGSNDYVKVDLHTKYNGLIGILDQKYGIFYGGGQDAYTSVDVQAVVEIPLGSSVTYYLSATVLTGTAAWSLSSPHIVAVKL